MEKIDKRDESPNPISKRFLLITMHIAGPAALMIFMALTHIHLLPRLSENPDSFHVIEMLLVLVWIAVLSYYLIYTISPGWIFVFCSAVAITFTGFTYYFAYLYGLNMGREEAFPGILIMLPGMGLLIIITTGIVVFRLVKLISAQIRKKRQAISK